MTKDFVAYQLLINYSLIIGKNQWLSADCPSFAYWLLIDVMDVID